MTAQTISQTTSGAISGTNPRTISLTLADEAATQRLGADLAEALKPGDCVALSGDLGAGKTTLARALIRALAEDPGLEVPSPTFTLVQSYALRLPIAHFDLYRLADASELDELGLDEALEEGAALIEWPERAEGALPADAITLTLETARAADGREGRSLAIAGPEEALARIGRSLAIRAFLAEAGEADAARHYLLGDASTRAYERIETGDGRRLVLMNAPRRPDGPVIRDGKPYSQLAHLAEDVRPFVAIDELLRGFGYSASRIEHADLEQGFLLIEDLGREGVLGPDGAPDPERYETAIDLLADLHGRDIPEAVTYAGGCLHRIPRYDRPAMGIETELLIDWYLPARRGGASCTDAERAAYLGHWSRLFDRLADAETSLVLRDYHSPNILWQGARDGIRRIGLIDFQDAMIGPAAYDVASLVQDARVTVEPALAERLLARYVAARRGHRGFAEAAFREAYAIMAAQRAAKILGIFIRLDRRDGKPGYLKHLPRIERYFAAALAHPALQPLHGWCEEARILPVES